VEKRGGPHEATLKDAEASPQGDHVRSPHLHRPMPCAMTSEMSVSQTSSFTTDQYAANTEVRSPARLGKPFLRGKSCVAVITDLDAPQLARAIGALIQPLSSPASLRTTCGGQASRTSPCVAFKRRAVPPLPLLSDYSPKGSAGKSRGQSTFHPASSARAWSLTSFLNNTIEGTATISIF
jgi:hypothetical protein